MDHTQLSILDLGIIAVYLLSMVAVGVYPVEEVRDGGHVVLYADIGNLPGDAGEDEHAQKIGNRGEHRLEAAGVGGQTESLPCSGDFDVRAGNGNRKEQVHMDHTQLSVLDLSIIGLYLAAMVAVGVYFVRRIKNTGDYYVAGRSLESLGAIAILYKKF